MLFTIPKILYWVGNSPGWFPYVAAFGLGFYDLFFLKKMNKFEQMFEWRSADIMSSLLIQKYTLPFVQRLLTQYAPSLPTLNKNIVSTISFTTSLVLSYPHLWMKIFALAYSLSITFLNPLNSLIASSITGASYAFLSSYLFNKLFGLKYNPYE